MLNNMFIMEIPLNLGGVEKHFGKAVKLLMAHSCGRPRGAVSWLSSEVSLGIFFG